jgi:hypothetical protein
LVSFYDNFFAKHQFGVRTNHRTTDSLFILKILITKYLFKKKRKICACFADLRKAFDTVWYSGFQYKLMKNNVGSKFFNIIQDMAVKRHEYHLIWKSRWIIVHENKK